MIQSLAPNIILFSMLKHNSDGCSELLTFEAKDNFRVFERKETKSKQDKAIASCYQKHK